MVMGARVEPGLSWICSRISKHKCNSSHKCNDSSNTSFISFLHNTCNITSRSHHKKKFQYLSTTTTDLYSLSGTILSLGALSLRRQKLSRALCCQQFPKREINGALGYRTLIPKKRNSFSFMSSAQRAVHILRIPNWETK